MSRTFAPLGAIRKGFTTGAVAAALFFAAEYGTGLLIALPYEQSWSILLGATLSLLVAYALLGGVGGALMGAVSARWEFSPHEIPKRPLF